MLSAQQAKDAKERVINAIKNNPEGVLKALGKSKPVPKSKTTKE